MFLFIHTPSISPNLSPIHVSNSLSIHPSIYSSIHLSMIFNLIIRILSSSIYSRLSQDGVRSRQYGRWLESQAIYALSTYSDHIGRNKNHESMYYNSTHPHYNHHRHHQYRYFTTQLLSERSRQFLTPGISCFNLSIYLYRLYTYLIYEY